MKTISNIAVVAIVLMVAWVSPVAAQTGPPEVGFIRVVHAVAPGSGKVSVHIDGDDIFPKGYELGQRTGGLGIKAGVHKITIEKEGVESGSTQVTLKTGETLSLIGFAEKVPSKEEGDPPVWKVKILRLKQSDPERGYRMTLVSVCDQKEVEIKAAAIGKGTVEKATVQRLKTTSLDLGNSRGEVLVKAGEDIVTTISPEDPGNYVVVLYQDAEGKIKALSFFDPKFVIAG
jgi:hypothetical protein